MDKGLYLSGASMIARQVRQEAVIDNLANSSTPGYKATRVFAQELQAAAASAQSLRDVERNQQTWTDFSQGTLQQTDRDLDLALRGDGFFTVRTADGERYTRNGNFALDNNGYLVTSQGHPVLTSSGPVRAKNTSLTINAAGDVFVGDKPAGRLLLRNFQDPQLLQRAGAGLFSAPQTATRVPANVEVCQGCLEGSNIQGIDAALEMMAVLRHYEAAQRIAKQHSETLGRAVNELIRG